MDLMVVKLTLDSRDVAKMVKKNHADLLRDIARYKGYLIKSKIAFNEFFQENQYKDKIGRTLKRYDVTRKGCEFLAHKMTGEKGIVFTATYINKFHEMEQALKKPRQEQTKLDFQEKDVIRTTWKGEPVIELVQLARYTHVREDNLRWHVRNDKLTLRYGDLEKYKKENAKVHRGNYNSVSILSKEQVIAICKKYGIYEKYRDFIDNYFRVDNRLEDKTPKVPVVRANFDKSKEEIDVQKAEVVSKTLPYIEDAQLRDYIAENLSRELLGEKFFRAFDCTMKCLALREDLNRKGLKHKREVEERMKNSESYLSLLQAGKDIIDSIFE